MIIYQAFNVYVIRNIQVFPDISVNGSL